MKLNSAEFILLLLLQIGCTYAAEKIDSKIYFLEDGSTKSYVPLRRRLGFYESDIRIYCYKGNSKTIWKYFQTNFLQLDIENDEYRQYEGATPEIVKAHHEEQISIFSFNFLLSYKKTRIKLNPFNQTCIGIDTLQPYKVELNLILADIWKIIYFLIGVFGFFFASSLSNNNIFYYLSGVTLGICASFVILVVLAGKMFPRRPLMYGVLLGGWTIAYYLLKLVWDNVQLILMSYYSYVLWYVFITGFISFIICYRMGPPSSVRSKNLIKWSLQLIAIVFIYFSSEIKEASIAVIILSICIQYFPINIMKYLYKFSLKLYPIQRRYLTMKEYEEQGQIETEKALKELREFCSSPKCKQWKTIGSLKNPKRFAGFIEGEGHVMDEEIFDHEVSISELTDSDKNDNDQYSNHSFDEFDNNISEDEQVIVQSKTNYRQKLVNRSNGSSIRNSVGKNRSNYTTRSRKTYDSISNSNNRYSRYDAAEYSEDDE